MSANEAARWLRRNTGQDLSPLAEKVATVISEMKSGGIYNAPSDLCSIDWTNRRYIEVPWKGSIANWDFPHLTSLWGWSNELGLRVEVEPNTSEALLLRFHERANLPTAEEQLKFVGLEP